ncbi:FAD-dependent monooxygenase [Myceligenerans cantabricum]
MRVVVAGGGIGGLATALAVAATGARVEVLERATELRELGAGIQLAPNAFRALEQLGVSDAVEAVTTRIDSLDLLDGESGDALVRVDTGPDYVSEFGHPYAVVHRGQLHAALVRACSADPNIQVHCSAHVVGYRERRGTVAVTLSDGRTFVGDVLIGADGIRSAVRRQLLGDGPPRISGHTIYRTMVPMDRVPAELRAPRVTLWAGNKWHFVHYPVAGGGMLNMAITRDDDAPAEKSGVPVDRDQVLREFGDLCPRAAGLLRLGEDWRSWVLCDRDPQTRWARGRVALLGDAAHPMLQYAAQGACMALEDAIVLSRALAGDGSVLRALRTYERLRRRRAGDVQVVARDMGSYFYHPSGGAAADRDGLLAALDQTALRAELAWLHGATTFTEGRGAMLEQPLAA